MPCGLVVFGLVLTVRILIAWSKVKASESWPKTMGVVLESTVQSEWTKAGNNRIYVVSPKVVYEYEVGGRKFRSSQLAMEEINTADESVARMKAEKYPVGRQVEVYYDPRKPDTAALQTGDPSKGILPSILVAVGLILVAIGIVWLLHVRR